MSCRCELSITEETGFNWTSFPLVRLVRGITGGTGSEMVRYVVCAIWRSAEISNQLRMSEGLTGKFILFISVHWYQ